MLFLLWAFYTTLITRLSFCTISPGFVAVSSFLILILLCENNQNQEIGSRICSALKEFKVGDKTYVGRLYREFKSDTAQLTKDLSSTASLKNELSAWLTEDSLVSLLRDVGFEQVSKIMFPERDNVW